LISDQRVRKEQERLEHERVIRFKSKFIGEAKGRKKQKKKARVERKRVKRTRIC